jgi:hypothetical protein
MSPQRGRREERRHRAVEQHLLEHCRAIGLRIKIEDLDKDWSDIQSAASIAITQFDDSTAEQRDWLVRRLREPGWHDDPFFEWIATALEYLATEKAP